MNIICRHRFRGRQALYAVLLSGLLLSACAHRGNPIVIPRPDGVFTAAASGDEKDEALKRALAVAKDECAARRRGYVVDSMTFIHRGSDAEAATADKRAKALDIGSFGDDPYRYAVYFRCEGRPSD